MDTVTGAIVYYTSSGGEFNSRGSEEAVASNPIVRQGKLIPTQPLLYNAYGQNTWVVPLVAETGKYQTVALVQAKNGHVVVGASSSTSPQADAFTQYATFLGVGAPPPQMQGRSVTSAIDRIAVLGTSVYFTVRGERRIFSYDARTDAAALLARSGDRVRFSWEPQSGGNASVSKFVDSALPVAP